MQANYISIYKITGVNMSPDDEDVELLSSEDVGARVFLTTCKTPYFEHLRKLHVLGLMSMDAFVVSNPHSVFSQKFDTLQEKFDDLYSRSRIVDNTDKDAPLLIIEIKENIKSDKFEPVIKLRDFSYGLHIFDETKLLLLTNEHLNVAIASLSISIPEAIYLKIKKNGTVTFLHNFESNRITYSKNFSMSCTHQAYISLNEALKNNIISKHRFIYKNKDIELPVQLLSSAMQESNKFQAFLTAWSGLEIFIKNTYDLIKKADNYYENLKKNSPIFFEEIASRSLSKYSIQEKFSSISYYYNNSRSELDIQIFDDVRKQRNKIHTMDLDFDNLPFETTCNILRKFILIRIEAVSKL